MGALGRKGYGYDVERLLDFFKEKLDQNELTKVMLIGVGNLGTALLKYNFFKNNNTRIVKAYDVDENKVGQVIADTPILPFDQLETDDHEDIRAAILTVPAEVAQSVADKLVLTGISGILNFTPVRLLLPDPIRVQHIDLAVELQAFIYFLKNEPLQNNGGGES